MIWMQRNCKKQSVQSISGHPVTFDLASSTWISSVALLAQLVYNFFPMTDYMSCGLFVLIRTNPVTNSRFSRLNLKNIKPWRGPFWIKFRRQKLMNMTNVVLVVHMYVIGSPNKTKVLLSISATILSHCIIVGEIPKQQLRKIQVS